MFAKGTGINGATRIPSKLIPVIFATARPSTLFFCKSNNAERADKTASNSEEDCPKENRQA